MPCTPAGTVLCNRPNTNSIVGTNISLYSIVGAADSHTVRPPTCLWASIVLWVPGFTVLGERGETPHMPLGIKQYLQVPTSTIPKEGNATSHRHLTFYSIRYGDGFPEPEECIMIFGGSDTIWTKRQHKVRYREACAAETTAPPSSAGQNP